MITVFFQNERAVKPSQARQPESSKVANAVQSRMNSNITKVRRFHEIEKGLSLFYVYCLANYALRVAHGVGNVRSRVQIRDVEITAKSESRIKSPSKMIICQVSI
jgi:hypothetical protein